MSYLLDALQKADRERASTANAEQFITASGSLAPAERGGSIGWALAVLSVVLLAAGSAWWWLAERQPSELSNTVEHRAVTAAETDAEQRSAAAASGTLQSRPAPTGAGQSVPLQLQINGHLVVAPGHSANKLFTDQGVLRHGSQLSSGWQLVEISQQRALFERNGVEQSLPLR